jgi:hypothetical protein
MGEDDSGYETEDPKRINDLFDLVGFTFDVSEISSDELFKYSPYLEEVKEVIASVCNANGTVNTIKDSQVKETASFKFGGSVVTFRTGLNEGVTRKVIGFSNGTITLDSNLANATVSGDRYFISKAYNTELETALDSVELDLYQKGLEMENIVDIEQIKPLILTRATMDICFARISARDDIWTYRYEGLEKKYNNMFEGLKLKLSTEADGIMDSDTSLSQPMAVR